MIDDLYLKDCITYDCFARRRLLLLLVIFYLALSDVYVFEDDEDDLGLKWSFVDDPLYRAWPHVQKRQSSIL